MPRNPTKAKCIYPSCGNWSRRNGPLCATHARAPTLTALDDAFAVLENLQNTTPSPAQTPLLELRLLYQARRVFTAWLRDTRARGERPISTSQFLRAWTHSAAIMMKLALLAETGKQTPYDQILDILENEIPMLRRMLNAAPSPGGSGAERTGARKEQQP